MTRCYQEENKEEKFQMEGIRQRHVDGNGAQETNTSVFVVWKYEEDKNKKTRNVEGVDHGVS